MSGLGIVTRWEWYVVVEDARAANDVALSKLRVQGWANLVWAGGWCGPVDATDAPNYDGDARA